VIQIIGWILGFLKGRSWLYGVLGGS